MVDPKKRAEILDRVAGHGGLASGVARAVSEETGVAEAEVYGAASFYHLLSEPSTKLRVCLGLSCQLRGSRSVLEEARRSGMPVEGCSCLAACDRAPAALRERSLLTALTVDQVRAAEGDYLLIEAAEPVSRTALAGVSAPTNAPSDRLAIDLSGASSFDLGAFDRAIALGSEGVLQELERSGLQGRGGAGFPAAAKWKAVRAQVDPTRYLVLNADEGEPGTFKDREVLLRRPDLVVEGLAIAARTIGARDIYCYLRGEFSAPRRALEHAIREIEGKRELGGLRFHLHAGHGAYICGEETALLEALEGRRGMPRIKPPFPTEQGLWGRPTLVHNVETIACVPSILARGGDWFRSLGKTGPGTKLYSLSGHVRVPGVYELPLGVSLDELVETGGGFQGNLLAFSPGGASSGFLPASERGRALDFASLTELGSMLGSAGVVVLNDSVDLLWAARQLLRFFEAESCGQCAPCRLGTRFQRVALDRFLESRASGSPSREALSLVGDVAWEMNEGSICGLGQVASLPLTSVLRHFPEVLGDG